jgi:hypothetical protein
MIKHTFTNLSETLRMSRDFKEIYLGGGKGGGRGWAPAYFRYVQAGGPIFHPERAEIFSDEAAVLRADDPVLACQ